VTSNLLVSVIIPTFNRSEQVIRAVKSVLSQTYLNLECIVVDDCSTDNTINMLNAIKGNDDRLTILVHSKNQHASAARNTGILAATGHYIAFLDDDDVWIKNKLSKQVRLLNNAPDDVGMVYCWFDIFDGDKKIGSRKPELEGDLFNQLLIGQPLGNASTLLVKSAVICKVGVFDVNLPRGNDGDFIRRVTKYYKVKVIKEVLVNYHVENVELNPRISILDNKGLINDINSIEVKLEKFRDDFIERPRIRFIVLKTLFQRYVVSQQYSNAVSTYKIAIAVSSDWDRYYLLAVALIRALITLGVRIARRIWKYYHE